jgi:hypothetical protein
MPLNTIPLTNITADDVQGLVDRGEREDRQLDYKEVLPNIKSKDERQEFLADLCAMATTQGGDIVYGIKEKRDTSNKPTGEPLDVVGTSLDNDNWDAKRRQLSEAIRDGIDPRLQGVEMHLVDRQPNLPVVIIRVPSSLRQPHMIRYRPSFYYRTEGGNSPMNADEIRQAFLRGASMQERADSFRRTRVASVHADDHPIELVKGGLAFLHVIPLGTRPYAIDLSNEDVLDHLRKLVPLPGGGFDARLNFDGYVNFVKSTTDPGKVESYVQVFRNGSVEFCDTNIVTEWSGQLCLFSPEFEEYLVAGLRRTLLLYERLIIAAPLVVFITLTGVKNAHLGTRRFNPSLIRVPHIIDRDRLFPPGQLIEQLEQQPEQVLKPILDTIWNAANYPRSLSYDDAGNWSPDRIR